MPDFRPEMVSAGTERPPAAIGSAGRRVTRRSTTRRPGRRSRPDEGQLARVAQPLRTGPYPWTTPVAFHNGELHRKADFQWPGEQESYQTANGANGFGLRSPSSMWFTPAMSVRARVQGRRRPATRAADGAKAATCVFKIHRYEPDYPGLAGKDLKPQGLIEQSAEICGKTP